MKVDPLGRVFKLTDPERHAEYRVVSGDYFRAMGIPRLEGRGLSGAAGDELNGGSGNDILSGGEGVDLHVLVPPGPPRK